MTWLAGWLAGLVPLAGQPALLMRRLPKRYRRWCTVPLRAASVYGILAGASGWLVGSRLAGSHGECVAEIPWHRGKTTGGIYRASGGGHHFKMDGVHIETQAPNPSISEASKGNGYRNARPRRLERGDWGGLMKIARLSQSDARIPGSEPSDPCLHVPDVTSRRRCWVLGGCPPGERPRATSSVVDPGHREKGGMAGRRDGRKSKFLQLGEKGTKGATHRCTAQDGQGCQPRRELSRALARGCPHCVAHCDGGSAGRVSTPRAFSSTRRRAHVFYLALATPGRG
ncbi:hypothetical protein B0T17DRAFT_503191 [Bombardia bombarda]|uniref:Uncharacterized protein n=1 Tax=Bombardia bombarda TaxID=252184 RepID=A0AA39XMG1_9PEZI|nr:hypothetical protein B0T17DRAFT_503191 [Bombardia bombarda]